MLAWKKEKVRKGKYTKFSKIVSTQRNVIPQILFFRNLSICLPVRSGGHRNPVSKRWQLVNDFADYEYSSASFYEKEIKKYENLVHINDALNNLIPGSPLTQSAAVKTPGWHQTGRQFRCKGCHFCFCSRCAKPCSTASPTKKLWLCWCFHFCNLDNRSHNKNSFIL